MPTQRKLRSDLSETPLIRNDGEWGAGQLETGTSSEGYIRNRARAGDEPRNKED
jgi:hypothetical protein